jgi:hypothetical protein
MQETKDGPRFRKPQPKSLRVVEALLQVLGHHLGVHLLLGHLLGAHLLLGHVFGVHLLLGHLLMPPPWGPFTSFQGGLSTPPVCIFSGLQSYF